MKQLTNDSSLQRIDLNPCCLDGYLFTVCQDSTSTPSVRRNNQSTVRFSSPRPIQKSRVSFLSYLFENGRFASSSFSASPNLHCKSAAPNLQFETVIDRFGLFTTLFGSLFGQRLAPPALALHNQDKDWLLPRLHRGKAPLEIGRKPDTGSSCQLRFGLGIVVTEIRLGGVPFGPSQMERLLCKQIQGRRWWIAAEEYPLPSPLSPSFGKEQAADY